MPQTVEQLLYLLMSAAIVCGVGIIGFLVKTGFSSVMKSINGLQTAVSELSQEIKREREARIRSGSRLWGEFVAMQKVCAVRHGLPAPIEMRSFQELESEE